MHLVHDDRSLVLHDVHLDLDERSLAPDERSIDLDERSIDLDERSIDLDERSLDLDEMDDAPDGVDAPLRKGILGPMISGTWKQNEKSTRADGGSGLLATST